MLTCKITLPDSPHRVIISKNPGFRALYLARQNEFRFFRLINTKIHIFSFLAAGFCPKNLAFARKIVVLPESGGLQPPAPWLVRLCKFGSFSWWIWTTVIRVSQRSKFRTSRRPWRTMVRHLSLRSILDLLRRPSLVVSISAHLPTPYLWTPRYSADSSSALNLLYDLEVEGTGTSSTPSLSSWSSTSPSLLLLLCSSSSSSSSSSFLL